MPLGSLGSTRVLLLLTELDLDGWSPTIVEVEEERLKVFASGARWVSFSSGGMSAGIAVHPEKTYFWSVSTTWRATGGGVWVVGARMRSGIE